MIIIADSGSTKTEWIILQDGEVINTFLTAGFNPYYFEKSAITEILIKDIPQEVKKDAITQVFYYGSGCSTKVNCKIVSDAFAVYFKHAKIHIYHDLLAAAHSLLGRNPGMACILGTGSSTCFYDGNKIVKNIPSLGYMLGDEGSANHIGKKLLTAILSGTAPEALAREFYSTYSLDFESTLRALYKSGKPGLFMAQFSSFVHKQIEQPICQQIVSSSFDEFIDAQLCHYETYKSVPVSFVGSVAWFFKDLLKQRLDRRGIRLGTILQSPAKGLVDYYKTLD